MNAPQARRIRLAISVAATTAATIAALGACSSSGSSGPAGSGGTTGAAPVPVAASKSSTVAAAAKSSSVDVCGLLSSAQASSINHVSYGAAKPTQIAANWNECTYTNTGKSDDPIDIQDLDVDVLSGSNCWQILETSPGPGKPVSGVGDAAFGYSIGLAIKDGSHCVQIEGLTHAELSNDYSRDIALAKIVLGKLH